MNVATKFPPGPTHRIPGKLLRQFVRDPINALSNIAPLLPRQQFRLLETLSWCSLLSIL